VRLNLQLLQLNERGDDPIDGPICAHWVRNGGHPPPPSVSSAAVARRSITLCRTLFSHGSPSTMGWTPAQSCRRQVLARPLAEWQSLDPTAPASASSDAG
jgi:hypothetical protein